MATIPELANALLACERVAIIPHISPDGDALGSALSVRHALVKLGKQAAVVCDDAPPRMYTFLPGIGSVVTPERLSFVPDGALLVDVSSKDRAGRSLDVSRQAATRLLIDHHATTDGFTGLSVIKAGASSTGELILALIDALSVPLDADLAVLLYAAIATDTGNFSFSNTTPEAMRAVARLLEAGLNIDECNRKLFRLRSVSRTRLIGEGLSRMEFAAAGRIAYIQLTDEVFEACAATHEDTEGLVNYLNEMEGVEVCFLVEQRGQDSKASLRSNGKIDVAQIARAMGGGGHERAAGVTLKMPHEAASVRLVDVLTRALGEA